MILAEQDTAPREDVLVERQRLLVLAAQVERGREPGHRPERRGIVFAEEPTPSVEHLAVEIPRAPEVAARREASDAENRALLERVNATGEIFISHTVLNGQYVLRLAVGNARTSEDDVRHAWDLLRRAAAR